MGPKQIEPRRRESSTVLIRKRGISNDIVYLLASSEGGRGETSKLRKNTEGGHLGGQKHN